MSMTINGSGTITGLTAGGLPDATITQPDLAAGVAGNGPAFSAYKDSAPQTVSNNTWTKVTFDVEEFDTNNNFTSSTFTPTVAGYYLVSASASWASGTGSYEVVIQIRKSGADNKALADVNSSVYNTQGSAVVYCNGSTDYLEVYVYQSSGGSKNIQNYSTETFFQAALVRAA